MSYLVYKSFKTFHNIYCYQQLENLCIDTLIMSRSDGGDKQPVAVFLLAALAAVGGFLFGYDTGVISGAMAVILEEDNG